MVEHTSRRRTAPAPASAASSSAIRSRVSRSASAAPASASPLHPWSQANLAAAKHPYDLELDDRLHLRIDALQHGIGTASCGPGVLPAYRLTPRAAHFELTFD